MEEDFHNVIFNICIQEHTACVHVLAIRQCLISTVLYPIICIYVINKRRLTTFRPPFSPIQVQHVLESSINKDISMGFHPHHLCPYRDYSFFNFGQHEERCRNKTSRTLVSSRQQNVFLRGMCLALLDTRNKTEIVGLFRVSNKK